MIIVAAAAITIAIPVAPSTPAQTPEPPTQANKSLRDLRDVVRRADGRNGERGNPLDDLLRAAESAKYRFMLKAFEEQRLFGCSARDVFALLERTDTSLAVAAFERRPGERTPILKGALQFAQELRNTLGECGDPEADEAEGLANLIVRRVRRLVNEDEAGDLDAMGIDEAADEVREHKRSLLEGQRVYECAAFRFYLLIERIDIQLQLALRASGNVSRDHERAFRADRVAAAFDLVRELQREWRKVPCGDESAPPPEELPPG